MSTKTTEKTLTPPPHTEPVVFTRDMLDWLPWLEPMAEAEMTARHLTSLVDAARVKSPYFRLLARDPDDGRGGRRIAFLSGNDAGANAEVATLATQFGFEPIDLGRNDAGGRLLSFGGPLTGHSFVSQRLAGDSPPEMDLAETN